MTRPATVHSLPFVLSIGVLRLKSEIERCCRSARGEELLDDGVNGVVALAGALSRAAARALSIPPAGM